MTTQTPASAPDQVIEALGLPSATPIDYQPISLRYRRVLAARVSLFVVLAAVALAIVTLVPSNALLPALEPLFVGPAVVAGLIAALVWAGISVRRKGYALREREIFYRRGVIWRSYTAVPFPRIQHVETHHGPLERWFGLAALKVYTAGATKADLQIPGLPTDEADRLHQFLLARAGEADGGD